MTALQPRAGRSLPLPKLSLATLVAGAAIGITTMPISHASLDWGIAAVLVAASVSSIVVAASPAARSAGVVLPFSFIGLWAVGFGLASMSWRNPSNDLLAQSRGLRQDSLPLGLAVAAGGLLAWCAGYCLIHLRLLRVAMSALRQWATRGADGHSQSIDYSLARVVGVFAAGLTARLVLLGLGRYSYITSDLQGAVTQSSPINAVLGHLEFLTTVGLLLLAHSAFGSGTRATRRLLVVALLIEVPFGLLGGMRSFIVLRLVGVALTYFLMRRRVPALAVVALVGVLAVISPFTDSYRAEVRDATGTTVDAAGAADLIPGLIGSTLGELSASDVLSGPSDFLTDRFRFVDEVAIVSQRTPEEVAYIPALDTLAEASTVLIPRQLWSDKPVYATGLQYARDFWNQPTALVSSRSPTYPGEAYFRGGWAGVIVLMALLGAVMAATSSSLSPRSHPPAIPLFVVAWTALMNIEGPLVLLSAGLAQSLLITAVAMRWALSKTVVGTETDVGSTVHNADRGGGR